MVALHIWKLVPKDMPRRDHINGLFACTSRPGLLPPPVHTLTGSATMSPCRKGASSALVSYREWLLRAILQGFPEVMFGALTRFCLRIGTDASCIVCTWHGPWQCLTGIIPAGGTRGTNKCIAQASPCKVLRVAEASNPGDSAALLGEFNMHAASWIALGLEHGGEP